MRSYIAWGIGALALLVAGCANQVGLTVDLLTDYQAFDQFGAVRTEISTSPYTSDAVVGVPAELAVAPRSNFLEGSRVAEFRGLASGRYWVRVSLLSDAGEVVASRITELAFGGSYALTSVITASCAGVSCPRDGAPSLTECNGGLCVEPTCSLETGDTCGPGSCARDADCTGGAVGDCARAVCEGGACLFGADDRLCPAGYYCDATRSCACGGRNHSCCPDRVCAAGTTCIGDATTAYGPICVCGLVNTPCCPTRACNPGATCVDTTAFGAVCICGQSNTPCCQTGAPCGSGLRCEVTTAFGAVCR